MSSSTSIVPLVLWGKHAPSHRIAVITCSYDQKTIITGTRDGQIAFWDLIHSEDGNVQIIPRNLILAYNCRVVDIACAPDGSYEHPNIISLAENGELCLWDSEDGLCLQMCQLPGTHTKLLSVQVTNGALKEWRLICQGLYSEVYVIDTMSLEVLYVLKCRLFPDWISCVCTIRLARRQEEVLVGLTVSCCLKVWQLRSASEGKSEPVYEQESKNLDCPKAKSMCCNPFTQRTILVISSKSWQIFDASDFSFLVSMPSPNKSTLAGGEFVTANRVLVWDKSGRAIMYNLPSRYLLGAEGNEPSPADRNIRAPTPICEFRRFDSTNCISSVHFSYGRRGPFYKLLFLGNTSGALCVWKVPDSEKADKALSMEECDVEISHNEVTMIDEGSRTTLVVDETCSRVVPHLVDASFSQLWLKCKPHGLIDDLEDTSKDQSTVTSSLYLPSQGRMVCGKSDGSIIVVSASKAAIAQLLIPKQNQNIDEPVCVTMKGHHGKVTCLLYPHVENPRYDAAHLVSGGADFTVRVWDLVNRNQVHVFNSHGGEIMKLLVTPPDCNMRFTTSICSVAQDHSVAILGLRERKMIMLASRHTFPVDTIRWRAKDDFLVVGCTDGTVYVWQMESGHLDRCVAGSVAYDILESCSEDTAAPSAAVREFRRKFRLHHLTSMAAARLPSNLQTPVIVQRMKSRLQNLQHQVTNIVKSESAPTQAQSGGGGGGGGISSSLAVLPPMRVCSLRTSPIDPEFHVVLLDPEALIRRLLLDEADFAASSGNPVNPKRQLRRSTSAQDQADIKLAGLLTGAMSYEIAKLLLSCVHAWGLDPGLDHSCTSKLGMIKPVTPVSFGLMTRGHLSLMLPGWHINHNKVVTTKSDATDGNIVAKETSNESPAVINWKQEFNSHWQLSSSLTTQHLVSIVSITNTLMSMDHASFITISEPYAGDPTGMSIRSDVKAGWSLLAALHCCLLPDAMQGLNYRPPLLHILARRWQDRCLEIREAAQAILLGELRRIGIKGRKQLIEAWSPHLPPDVDTNDFGFEDLEAYVNIDEDKPVSPPIEEERADIAMIMMTTRKMVSSDIRLRHATAIVMLGVIGAEFQREVDPLLVGREGGKSQLGNEFTMDINTVRNTAKALTSLLLRRPSSKASAYSAIRRAAIDLIGRGFALWEPHIDVSQVLVGLLELCVSSEIKARQIDADKPLTLSPPADLHRSARHSLSLIATARPSAFITTLAKEVARQVALSSSMSFNQPSPAAIAVYSHVRHQPSSSDGQSSNVIQLARFEILRLIELMIDKRQQEVIELIVEVVDVVVHCIDSKTMKEQGLLKVFPALTRFSMVSYCTSTRRLAVGSRIGHIALYELRSSRCQLIQAHNAPVTVVAFSPEGKVLASYCHRDTKLSFWQTSTSLLGMLSSTIKCVQSYNTKNSTANIPPNIVKSVRLVWINKKNVVLLFSDQQQFKYSV